MEVSLQEAANYRRYYQRLEPIFKNNKVQAYFMVVLSLFTISFFSIFAIRPTLKTIAALQRQIIDRESVNQQLEEKINSLIQAQQTYQQIDSDLPKIYSLLPEKPEFPSFLRRMEIITSESQVELSNIQFDPFVLYSNASAAASLKPAGGGTNYQTSSIFFSAALNADYPKLTGFLDQLIKLDRLVSINTVSLTGNQTAGINNVNLSIQSKAHYLPLSL